MFMDGTPLCMAPNYIEITIFSTIWGGRRMFALGEVDETAAAAIDAAEHGASRMLRRSFRPERRDSPGRYRFMGGLRSCMDGVPVALDGGRNGLLVDAPGQPRRQCWPCREQDQH